MRLRLARTGDAAGLAALLARLGLTASELELRRALGVDLRTRTAICATALVGGRERLLGVAVGRERAELLLTDPELGDGLAGLLEDALRERAAA